MSILRLPGPGGTAHNGSYVVSRAVLVKTGREKTRTKLSYKEARELEALPKAIAALEAEQQALAAKLHAPEYCKQPPDVLRTDQQRIGEIEALLHRNLERWEALEAKSSTAAP